MELCEARNRAAARLVEIIDRHAARDADSGATYTGTFTAKDLGSAEIAIRAANAIAALSEENKKS